MAGKQAGYAVNYLGEWFSICLFLLFAMYAAARELQNFLNSIVKAACFLKQNFNKFPFGVVGWKFVQQDLCCALN